MIKENLTKNISGLIPKKIKGKVLGGLLSVAIGLGAVVNLNDNIHFSDTQLINPNGNHYIIGMLPTTKITCEEGAYKDFIGKKPTITTIGVGLGLVYPSNKIIGDCSKVNFESKTYGVGILNLTQNILKKGAKANDLISKTYGVGFLTGTGNILKKGAKAKTQSNYISPLCIIALDGRDDTIYGNNPQRDM